MTIAEGTQARIRNPQGPHSAAAAGWVSWREHVGTIVTLGRFDSSDNTYYVSVPGDAFWCPVACIEEVFTSAKPTIQERDNVFLVPATSYVEVPKAVGFMLKAWIASKGGSDVKVSQIKAVRQAMNLGLKEAKDIVDAFHAAA